MVSGTGGLGSGTAIRAPESEALHGFVGNGTDGSSISKIIDQKGVTHGRPAARRPRTKLFQWSPSRPCLPGRRYAPHGIPANGIGEPRRASRHGAAAGRRQTQDSSIDTSRNRRKSV